MLGKFYRYLKIYNLKELVWFWITDKVVGFQRSKSYRISSALRYFSTFISPEDTTLEKGVLFFNYDINGNRNYFELRKNDSDVAVFNQVILQGEYAVIVDLLLKNYIDKPRIIDAGSNIGLTTLYLKNYLPQARIICIEPEKNNVAQGKTLLSKNNIFDVRAIEKGLWTDNNALYISNSFRDNQSWSFSLQESPQGNSQKEIPTVTLHQVVAEEKWDKVDFLKIDIEGAESKLFRDRDFVVFLGTKTRFISIEVHPEFIHKDEVNEILERQHFFTFESGELIIGINKKLVSNFWDLLDEGS